MIEKKQEWKKDDEDYLKKFGRESMDLIFEPGEIIDEFRSEKQDGHSIYSGAYYVMSNGYYLYFGTILPNSGHIRMPKEGMTIKRIYCGVNGEAEKKISKIVEINIKSLEEELGIDWESIKTQEGEPEYNKHLFHPERAKAMDKIIGGNWEKYQQCQAEIFRQIDSTLLRKDVKGTPIEYELTLYYDKGTHAVYERKF